MNPSQFEALLIAAAPVEPLLASNLSVNTKLRQPRHLNRALSSLPMAKPLILSPNISFYTLRLETTLNTAFSSSQTCQTIPLSSSVYHSLNDTIRTLTGRIY